jgi:Cytochrome c7 and related cytochrome c
MGQVFHPSTNTIAKVSIVGTVFLVAAIVWVLAAIVRSPYLTGVGVVRDQPVPFSHKHHTGDLGIDCRYCHTSVEQSAFAGMPTSETCMHCHSQIFSDSPMLQPVRLSFQTGQPLQWTRVHNLPDYAYFDHSIHIAKGFGCVTCHGQVDQMPLTWRENTLFMEWCLDCHRQPERYVRPVEYVFSMNWQPPADQIALGKQLVAAYHIQSKTNCSDCHR